MYEKLFMFFWVFPLNSKLNMNFINYQIINIKKQLKI